MRGYLEGFGPISLREQSGVDAVSALTGRKDIALSADPVFLMPASHWKRMAAPAARPPHGRGPRAEAGVALDL